MPLKISAAEEPSHAVAEQLKTAAKSKRWYAKPASMIAGGIAALGIIGAVLSGMETVLDKTQEVLDFFGVQLWEKKAQIVLATYDIPLVLPKGARDIVFLTITKKSRAPVSNCHVEAWMGGSTATVKRPAESFSMGSGMFTQHLTVEVESPSVPEGLKWGVQVTVVCDDGVSSEPLVVPAVLYQESKHK